MKVSIIVPFHNEIRYLSDCLESIHEQTMKDLEVILVCDHVECDVNKMISQDEYNIPVRVLELGDNQQGVAYARDLGLKSAQGEYVFFLDCDDYIEKDMLEKLLEADADVAFGKIHSTWYKRQVYYENGKELDEANVLQTHFERKGNVKTALIDTNDFCNYVSCLGILIRKSLLEENSIEYMAGMEKRYLSDYGFICAVWDKAAKIERCEDAIYIKRNHNDPINLPALSQEKDKTRLVKETVETFTETIKNISETNKELRDKMSRQFLVTMTRQALPEFFTMKASEQKQLYEIVHKALMQIDNTSFDKMPSYERGVCKKARDKNLAAALKKIKIRGMLSTLKRITLSRAALKKYLYANVFAKKKMYENTVLLESFFGKSYSDSPKYIFEYLNEKYPGKYNYVWVMNEKKKLPYPAKQIKRFSFRYYSYLARCKYIVFNSRQPVYFVKRPGNVFLETWHGTPLKKLVFDMEEVTTASPLYKEQFYTQTRSWDYLVAPNEFSAEVFTHAFMYDGPMLRFGYPRNDILHRPDKEQIAVKIIAKLGIEPQKKVILYAPTWRDDEFYGSGQYKFTLKLELDKMKASLGEEYVVLLRTHYFVADFLDVSSYGDFVKNVSKYDDIAELYLISDLLITDYSSVFFDYANLKRPILFYVYDYEKYRDVLRGFYINMEEEIPGPLLYDTEQVIEEIKNIDTYGERFQTKSHAFYEKYCGFEDGHATENIVNEVFNK